MIRKGRYVHNIDVLLPSRSYLAKMQRQHWKSRLPLVLSFFLGSLLTRWIFYHSAQIEHYNEQAEWSSPMGVSQSLQDEFRYATESMDARGTTGPFMATQTGPELPPYPEFVGNQQSILTPDSCGNDLFLLIVVISPSGDFEAREAIRSSWGRSLKSQSSHKVIFSVGCEDATDERVEREANKNGDILRGNFRDVYRQNEYHTMKALAALKWASSLCSSTKYVLIVPSTSFVNVLPTVTWLRSLSQDSGQPYKADFYAGLCQGANNKGPAPIRDPQSLWYIPVSYWPDQYLPVYASSVGIVVSVDVAGWITSISTEVAPIHIEDIYIGILARRLGIICADERPRFDSSYATMLTECEHLQLCVIGSVPAKDLNYLSQNEANLREMCKPDQQN